MRPERFTQLLLTAARTIPGVTSADAVPADERHQRPYLITVQAGGKTSRWQVVATSAPGDRYNVAELEPTIGTKPAPPEARPAEVGSPDHMEQALIAAVLEADQGEIAAVDLYSRRTEPPAAGHGATVLFRDGSKIYLNRA